MNRQDRKTQFTKALIELRSLVLDGSFPSGARLPETSLADRLGLSRTPLRQAMDRLVDEGLLERIETGGCRVASFSMADIMDAIELRGVLEGTAARLAAERGAVPALAQRMTEVLDALDAVVSPELDFRAYVSLNEEFHSLLARLAGSSIVAREVERANRLPAASPTAFLQGQDTIPDFRDSLRRAQTQHRAIFEAILAREGARAEALAREHARLARTNLEYVMREKPSLAGKVPGLALVAD
ncbi:GntR family transcriptional regulator [Ruegeria marina]|uniref:GntR family transcriptional regulator, vanillate catabolism transcriptional regulator n=1 Tax=Ruegeria marina TaxID=639004 RepID=A0A1G7BJB5_9RHOB|nr:GntR family transcriptional regulator [Ruegeria marina]SDE27208.1 GntR family transcriptional regulator, vanillate catabolism transcriptional regulator [Ruegeria marina]